MSYIASACLGDHLVRGTGPDEASARAACEQELRQIHDDSLRCISCHRQFTDGGVVSLDTAARLPAELPGHLGILVMQRCGHSDGEPYEDRIFGVPRGPISIHKRDWIPGAQEYVIGDDLVMHSFLDCNAEYEFPLPEGSVEFIEGAMVPCAAAAYDY